MCMLVTRHASRSFAEGAEFIVTDVWVRQTALTPHTGTAKSPIGG